MRMHMYEKLVRVQGQKHYRYQSVSTNSASVTEINNYV